MEGFDYEESEGYALIWLIRFIRRHRKKRIKAPKIKPIKKKYLR